jgi:hypothetical protein
MKVYKEIWTNFFNMTGVIVPSEPAYFPSTRERFKKLLKRTEDYFYIMHLLNQFEGIMSRIEETMKNKTPSIRLYTTNLIMDIQHLRALIDVVDIPAAYLLLRNLLENFVKVFIYLDVGRSIDPNLVLYSMFLYEYETTKNRRYSLKGFRNESTRKFLKVASSIPSDKPLDLTEFLNKLKEKQIPTLGVNPKVLEEFSESYGLNEADLDKLYSACSAIIHNQPPLPFFSLLEVKFFKHFLRKYIQSLRIAAEKLINEKIDSQRIIAPLLKEKTSLKKSLEVAYLLEAQHDPEVKAVVKKALATLLQKREKGSILDSIWIEPLTLTSVFHIISPTFTHLRKLSFIEEDLEDIIEELQPLSFKVSIRNEVDKTLGTLQELILPELQKYRAFSSLRSIEQKKVIFYLLLEYLPRIIEEMMKR